MAEGGDAIGTLFPSVSGPGIREGLEQRVLSQECLTPTFGSFSQDILYLALLMKVLTFVLPRRLEHSVFETLQSKHRGQGGFNDS
jgi:hypothetical protein